MALPGGFGTLEELAEILTWSQLGLQSKPSGLLDVEGFFEPLLAFFDHTVTERFVSERHRALRALRRHPRHPARPARGLAAGPRRDEVARPLTRFCRLLQ